MSTYDCLGRKLCQCNKQPLPRPAPTREEYPTSDQLYNIAAWIRWAAEMDKGISGQTRDVINLEVDRIQEIARNMMDKEMDDEV